MLSKSLLPMLFIAAVLAFVLAPISLQRVMADQWYMAKWTQAHDHGDHGDHADHAAHAAAAPAAPRVWEPYHEIDPRTVNGFAEMYEVTQFPRAEATTAQRRQAEEFLRRCREAAARHGWSQFEKAARDGYELLPEDPWHYVNTQYALDDKQLDPDRPEILMFYDTPAGKRLAAFMFLARNVTDHGRQIGGPLTLWHFHVWAKARCFREGWFVIGDPDANGRCAKGVLSSRSPEMMHVWLIDHPEGPFSGDMTLTDEIRKRLDQPVSH